jgi:hypothetical protein
LDFDVVRDDHVEDTEKTEIESCFFVCVEEFEDREEAVGGYDLILEIVVFFEEIVNLIADGD